MDDYSRRRLNMLRGVLVFGDAHGDDLPTAGQMWLTKVTQSVTRIDELSPQQQGSSNTAHGAVIASGAAFERMYKIMKRMHDTADAIDFDDDLPDIADDFPLPSGRNLQTWLTAAQNYILKATPVAQHFVAYGMKADFLTRLTKAKKDVQDAEDKQDEGDQSSSGATPAIETQLRLGLRAVRSLGAIVKNVFEDDEQTLREWKSASDIEAAPQSKTTTTPTA